MTERLGLMIRKPLHLLWLLALLVPLGLTQRAAQTQAQSSSQNIFALTSDNRLVDFSSSAPGVLQGSRPVSGLASGETLLGIDFRPATGQLFAISSNSQLYTLNPFTGAATAVGTGPLTTTVQGAAVGFDFNPTVDRIRLASETGQNLRLNPNTGALAAIDGTLAYSATDTNAGATPEVVAAGYTNNVSPTLGVTPTTTLYVIDAGLDVLATQNPPNAGVLNTVGALGVDAGDLTSFDIGPSGLAYVAIAATGETTSTLYSLNLASGALTEVGAIGGGATVTDIAIPTLPTELPGADVFALTSGGRLIRFGSTTPETLKTGVTISGLASGETLLGIDFRPATGQLFAISSNSQLYTLNPLTGAATAVGTGPLTTTVQGVAVGFDFNPTVDRIRLASETGQNLRLNPNTGALAAIDGTLAYSATDTNAGATPEVVAAGYTNNVSPTLGVTPTTTLYVIDAGLDVLATQNPPNAGVLNTVGALGVDAGDLTSFDITPGGGAYVAIAATGETTSTLYSLNLASGALTEVGAIGGGETIVAIAVPLRNVPTLNFPLILRNAASSPVPTE